MSGRPQGFLPAQEALFFKSTKTGDPRWGERAQTHWPQDAFDGAWVLAGYTDDEGIALNQGRPGAALGPDAIRARFYKCSLSSEQVNSNPQLIDLGNIDRSLPLAERHECVRSQVSYVLTHKGRWLGLGGGHDYAYGDGAGFLDANHKSSLKPLIINIDAHLDVRPTDQGLSSGTPFYRLLQANDFPDFDLYEIGIQRQCNSANHVKWAQDQGAHIHFLEDLLLSGSSVFRSLMDIFSEVLTQPRPTYLSVDIDGFSSAFAMGASQAWPMGLNPNDVLPFFSILKERLAIQVLGIYEVSPPLDQDERTVKLASQIIHPFMV